MAAREATVRKWRLFAAKWVETEDGPLSAEHAGYQGKNLGVQASKLLAKPEVQDIIKELRGQVASTPVPVQDRAALEGEFIQKQVIGLEEKRAKLWEIACRCSEIVQKEDVHEDIHDDGSTTRIITITERVFDPKEAISAIHHMNMMDGDVQQPGQGGPGGGMHIEKMLVQWGITPT